MLTLRVQEKSLVESAGNQRLCGNNILKIHIRRTRIHVFLCIQCLTPLCMMIVHYVVTSFPDCLRLIISGVERAAWTPLYVLAQDYQLQ